MADDLIRYDVLVQDALRGVVRKVLREVADSDLPGEHHFYIAFDTTAPGVRMSSRLRQQHQFWDLSVTDHAFEVGLSFGGVPERLLIPFAAIKGFFDPSVQFGLQFDSGAAGKADGSATPAEAGSVPALSATADEEVGGEAVPEPAVEGDGEPREGAEVVSLDAFRKKT